MPEKWPSSLLYLSCIDTGEGRVQQTLSVLLWQTGSTRLHKNIYINKQLREHSAFMRLCAWMVAGTEHRAHNMAHHGGFTYKRDITIAVTSYPLVLGENALSKSCFSGSV